MKEAESLEMSRGTKYQQLCNSFLTYVFSMISLKVDNLTYRTTNRDLEYLFEKYGTVRNRNQPQLCLLIVELNPTILKILQTMY